VEEAGLAAGVSHFLPYRWLGRAGGVKSNGPRPVSGRYLSLAEREEIALGVAAGESLYGACPMSGEDVRQYPPLSPARVWVSSL
jgi:hypothetical protein